MTTPIPVSPTVKAVNDALDALRARAKARRLSGRLGVVVFVHFQHGEERLTETMECAPPEKTLR